jgi:hypothetical protein
MPAPFPARILGAAQEQEAERRHQLILIESLVRRGCSEREITDALEGKGSSWMEPSHGAGSRLVSDRGRAGRQ